MHPLALEPTDEPRRIATSDLATVFSLAETARIERWIRNAMARNGVEDPQAIGIEISGRKVVLTGCLSNWAQYRGAIDAAKAAPGIRLIEDLIQTC